MGKRNVVVVYSSSEEEEEEEGDIHSPTATSLSKSKSKSKSRQSSIRSRSSSALKRPRRSLLPPREPYRTYEINFDAFCEGFYENLRESPGIQNSPSHTSIEVHEVDNLDISQQWRSLELNCNFIFNLGSCKTELEEIHKSGPLRSGKELWVDKYKPQSLEELVVHKKKVEEVKTWLEESMINSKDEFHNHTLVITGPAGVGKSATIRVVASHLGVELCEWNTPTPTLWREHIHNSISGVSYMSKLDEFETFVERIRKYSLLPLSSTGGSRAPYIVLIDDLPLVNGKVAYGRMCKCLHVLARSTQIPTIILITEHSKVEPAEDTTCHWENLQSCLETAGARKVAFNPVTVNATKKTLSRICKQEDCTVTVTAEQIDLIAKASGGDIRHAVTSLQYCCLTRNEMLFLSISNPIGTHPKDKSHESAPSDGGFILPFGKDETLSLFHALGKFLHNKRETVHASRSGQEIFLLSERFVRLPLKMDAPENILCQAHGQTRSIIDFLHENVLDFISDEAISDAWDVTSYLSDADCILAAFNGSTWSRTTTGQHQLEKLSELAAASVAVRGVLFGNSHPSPSRWHAIRSPKLWPVEQSLRRNKNEMRRQGVEAFSNSRLYDMDIMATEYRPLLKWLGIRASEIQEKMSANMMEVYNSERACWNDTEDQTPAGGNEDDDIEDW